MRDHISTPVLPRPRGGSAPSWRARGKARSSASALALALLGASALPALELTLDWKVGDESVIFKESIRARGSGLYAVL